MPNSHSSQSRFLLKRIHVLKIFRKPFYKISIWDHNIFDYLSLTSALRSRVFTAIKWIAQNKSLNDWQLQMIAINYWFLLNLKIKFLMRVKSHVISSFCKIIGRVFTKIYKYVLDFKFTCRFHYSPKWNPIISA